MAKHNQDQEGKETVEFFQDLDKGSLRDAGYVYGPGTPRALFAGIKIDL